MCNLLRSICNSISQDSSGSRFFVVQICRVVESRSFYDSCRFGTLEWNIRKYQLYNHNRDVFKVFQAGLGLRFY